MLIRILRNMRMGKLFQKFLDIIKVRLRTTFTLYCFGEHIAKHIIRFLQKSQPNFRDHISCFLSLQIIFMSSLRFASSLAGEHMRFL